MLGEKRCLDMLGLFPFLLFLPHKGRSSSTDHHPPTEEDGKELSLRASLI